MPVQSPFAGPICITGDIVRQNRGGYVNPFPVFLRGCHKVTDD